MRTTFLVLALGLATVVAAVVAIGYALPQGHVASRTAVLDAPPAQVFATILDVARHSEWRPNVEKVEVAGTDPLRWREHSGGDVIPFEVVESRPHALLRVRIAASDLPFGGTWSYELEPQGTGTRITITEHGEVYNPIFRFMSRFVFGHTATIDSFLGGLQTRVASR